MRARRRTGPPVVGLAVLLALLTFVGMGLSGRFGAVSPDSAPAATPAAP